MITLANDLSNAKIAVIGLGYVGLPLAVEFGRNTPTIGFDIDEKRIAELRRQHDATREVEPEAFKESTQLAFSSNLADLADANVYIVTVPTPIDQYKRPDMRAL